MTEGNRVADRYGALSLVGFQEETALRQFECEECKILDGGRRLGHHITRGIVLTARKEGKVGISFGRYGDSPERNGVPAKGFAVVADTAEELEAHLARYEPTNNNLVVAVDDTLCKGMESWACYGLQPINRLIRAGGTVFVTSMQTADALLTDCHRKGAEWTLGVIPGTASFSGL